MEIHVCAGCGLVDVGVPAKYLPYLAEKALKYPALVRTKGGDEAPYR